MHKHNYEFSIRPLQYQMKLVWEPQPLINMASRNYEATVFSCSLRLLHQKNETSIMVNRDVTMGSCRIHKQNENAQRVRSKRRRVRRRQSQFVLEVQQARNSFFDWESRNWPLVDAEFLVADVTEVVMVVHCSVSSKFQINWLHSSLTPLEVVRSIWRDIGQLLAASPHHYHVNAKGVEGQDFWVSRVS